jgi:O-antigen/teichoic acid export membrane protein
MTLRRTGWRRPWESVAAWRRGEFGGLAGDSFYVAIWQGAVSLADLAQIALITHALGLDEYGRFAVAVAFVTLVAKIFDVRVGVAATMFGARELGRDSRRAAGVFQLSYLIDLITGVVGFAVVAALSLAVGPGLVGEQGSLLIVLYAAALLASTVEDSSVAVLRLCDRFRLVAACAVPLEAARVGMIAGAFLISKGLLAVMVALIVQKALATVVQVGAAAWAFRAEADRPLLRDRAIGAVGDLRRQVIRTVFHTNVVSYARLAQSQLPTVVLGAISGPLQAGLYKIGMAAAAAIGRLADPAYIALLPRVSRLLAAGRRLAVRSLVERASLVSVPAMAAALAALIVLRGPVLDLLGGSGSADAAPVLIMGGIAYAINGAAFWNVGVLFAAGRSRAVAWIAVAGAAVQLLLLVPLVLVLDDATGAALSFLCSLTLTNLAATLLALHAIRQGGGAQAEVLATDVPIIEPVSDRLDR